MKSLAIIGGFYLFFLLVLFSLTNQETLKPNSTFLPLQGFPNV